MPVSGTLDDLSLSDLFAILTLRRATGRLILQRGQDEAYLYFEDGRLIYASSSTVTHQLGELLIRQGKLSREQLALALEWQRIAENAPAIGAIVVEWGLLAQADVEEALIGQAEDILYDLLTWSEGLFEFKSKRYPVSSLPLPRLNLERITLEAVRRADERAARQPPEAAGVGTARAEERRRAVVAGTTVLARPGGLLKGSMSPTLSPRLGALAPGHPRLANT